MYIFSFLSILIGYFEHFVFVFVLIFFHELGHFSIAKMFGFKVDKIYLYPTGGISKYTGEINISIFKDFLVLIAGPLMQIITYCILVKIYPYDNSIHLLKSIHYSILIFNLLPIYPLDGGKLLNLVFSLIFSYRTSLNLTIIFSYINIVSLILVFPFHFNINYLFMSGFLLCKLTMENVKKNYYFDKFLLERYLHSYSFNKVKVVNSVKKFKRGYRHIINDNGVYDERIYLNNKYKKKIN